MTPRIVTANLTIRLKSFTREKSALFFTIAFPVILVLVFGAIFTNPDHPNYPTPLISGHRFIDFFVPGIIAMAVMTSSLSGALNMNAELRQKGILRKLATTPITRSDWLLANILYQLVLAAITTTAILLVSYVVFHARLRPSVWLPAYLLLEVFVFVGIGMLLTPIAKEAESATAAANALLFPMMFLSGTFFPVAMMPGFLQTVARFLPLYYINDGLRAAMLTADTLSAARCAAITAAFAAIVFIAGTLVTRWDKEA